MGVDGQPALLHRGEIGPHEETDIAAGVSQQAAVVAAHRARAHDRDFQISWIHRAENPRRPTHLQPRSGCR